MDLGKLHLKMGINMKESFIMDFCMEKANLSGPITSSMRASLQIKESQEMEFIDGLMEVYIKDK